jgi:hypothetical protein
MILERIRHLLSPNLDEEQKKLMNERQMMSQIHQDWKAKAFVEAERRFLVLSPMDASETHWKVANHRGDVVFPTHTWGATRFQMNGFFQDNPQV